MTLGGAVRRGRRKYIDRHERQTAEETQRSFLRAPKSVRSGAVVWHLMRYSMKRIFVRCKRKTSSGLMAARCLFTCAPWIQAKRLILPEFSESTSISFLKQLAIRVTSFPCFLNALHGPLCCAGVDRRAGERGSAGSRGSKGLVRRLKIRSDAEYRKHGFNRCQISFLNFYTERGDIRRE